MPAVDWNITRALLALVDRKGLVLPSAPGDSGAAQRAASATEVAATRTVGKWKREAQDNSKVAAQIDSEFGCEPTERQRQQQHAAAVGEVVEVRRVAAVKWWRAMKKRVPRQVAAMVTHRLRISEGTEEGSDTSVGVSEETAPSPNCPYDGPLGEFASAVVGASDSSSTPAHKAQALDSCVMIGGSLDVAEALLLALPSTARLHLVKRWEVENEGTGYDFDQDFGSGDYGTNGDGDERNIDGGPWDAWFAPDSSQALLSGSSSLEEAEARLAHVPPCVNGVGNGANSEVVSRARFTMGHWPNAAAGEDSKWLPSWRARQHFPEYLVSEEEHKNRQSRRLAEDRGILQPAALATGLFAPRSLRIAFVAVAPGEEAWPHAFGSMQYPCTSAPGKRRGEGDNKASGGANTTGEWCGGDDPLVAALRAWWAVLRPGGVLCGSNLVEGQPPAFLRAANAHFGTAPALYRWIKEEEEAEAGVRAGNSGTAQHLEIHSAPFDPLIDFAPSWWMQKPLGWSG